MPCYEPMVAVRNPGGKLVFSHKASPLGRIGQIILPCRKCIGCRLDYSKQWALRCVHEAQMHEHNCMLTLTYNNDYLPKDHSLNHEHFQVFIRSLRKKTHKPIRYFMCGEYGEATSKNNMVARPHYHCLLFGISFHEDRKIHYRKEMKKSQLKIPIYRSSLLESTWQRGFSEIGSVTYQSAAYVARYVLKKQSSLPGTNRIETFDAETGEINGSKVNEYTKMSLKPGIGQTWYQKYNGDIDWTGENDKTNQPGRPHIINPATKTAAQIPQYYKKLHEKQNPIEYEQNQRDRLKKAKTIVISDPELTPSRRYQREFNQRVKAQKLKRELHDT